jgi:hypothetical protein
VTLDLHTYSQNAAEYEFHGDLTLTLLTGQWSNIEFGFCLSRDETNWDCLRSRGNYDPSQSSSGMALKDGYYTGAASDFQNFRFKEDDETAETDQNKWLFINGKSNSDCTKTDNAANAVFTEFAHVSCNKVNSHFKRYFQDDQKTQDLQLTLDDAGVKVKGFGWVASYSKTDFSGQASW